MPCSWLSLSNCRREFYNKQARPLLEEYAIEELIDPMLGSHYSEHEVSCMIHAASLCIRRDPYSRPRMSQVRKTFQQIFILVKFYMNVLHLHIPLNLIVTDIGFNHTLVIWQWFYSNILWRGVIFVLVWSKVLRILEGDTVMESPRHYGGSPSLWS